MRAPRELRGHNRPPLPSDLSGLIDAAIDDGRTLNRYLYDLTDWGYCVVPVEGGLVRLGFAGMVMAARYELPTSGSLFPDDFRGIGGNVCGKLLALEKIRFGETMDALLALGYDGRNLLEYDGLGDAADVYRRLSVDQLEAVDKWDESHGLNGAHFSDWWHFDEFARDAALMASDFRAVGL